MSYEENSHIEAVDPDVTVEQDIDPELVDDREADETDVAPVDLPEYDPTQFEEPDAEYVDEDGEE